MNTHTPRRPSARSARQHGFTLVELMVTVAIALFLLGGLVTIVQNVRTANLNQTALAQLQDEQRFAMTVITDAVQSGGYFADPTTQSTAASLPATGPFLQPGWVFAGSHTVGAADTAAQDTIATRFQDPGGLRPDPLRRHRQLEAGGDYTIQFSLECRDLSSCAR